MQIVPPGRLAIIGRRNGLEPVKAGTARNLAAALARPLVMFLPESRLRCISRVHWAGWSAYVLFRHPR